MERLKMKYTLFALAMTALFGNLSAHDHKGYRFEAYETKYSWSTGYQFESQDGSSGMAHKKVLSPWTSYQLYDCCGNYQGYGYIQLSFWGLFGPWGAELPVYDAKGDYVGLIDGQVATTAEARYTIYDAKGDAIAIAFLDKQKSGFTIVDAQNQNRTLALLKRQFISDAPDYWEVQVNDQDRLPVEIVKVFAAFAVDKHGAIRADT